MSEDLSFQIEKHARERWWHEDHLINQRTTWLLTTQGILAGGFGFLRYRIADVLNDVLIVIPPGNKNKYVETLNDLSAGLLIIGFVSSLVSFVGIHAAVVAQRNLAAQYAFPLGVAPKTTTAGQFVARATPALCFIAWFLAFFTFKFHATVRQFVCG